MCEVKTRTSDACGRPHEAVTAAKVAPAAAARRGAGWPTHGVRPAGRAGRPGGRAPAATRALGDRARAGDRLMPVATAHTISLQGALGHLIEVQADVSTGHGRHHRGRPARRLPQRGARPVPDGRSSTAGWSGRPPSGSRSCSRRPTWPSAAPTSTWRSPWRCSPPPARSPGRPRAAPSFVGELTLTGGLRSVPGVLPMVLAAAARGIRHVFVPEPQAREAAMVPGMAVLGMRSLAQVAAELRGERGARGAARRADVGQPAAVLARPGAAWTRSTWPTCSAWHDASYAVEVAAAGGHHLMLTGPEGAGQDHARRADPGPPARPDGARSRSS